MAKKSAPRQGQHYNDAEIALIYLVEPSDEAKALLANTLGRTEGGIEMVWRWVDHARFPTGAFNKIRRQVEWAENQLGVPNRGKIKIM